MARSIVEGDGVSGVESKVVKCGKGRDGGG
jgi:hypothetical protein